MNKTWKETLVSWVQKALCWITPSIKTFGKVTLFGRRYYFVWSRNESWSYGGPSFTLSLSSGPAGQTHIGAGYQGGWTRCLGFNVFQYVPGTCIKNQIAWKYQVRNNSWNDSGGNLYVNH